MAQTLGSVAVGTLVKLNESGSPVEFYVAKHDYESGLNGAGRTLLVRKTKLEEDIQWDAGNVNAYASSDIDAWLNGTYKARLDADVQIAIGTTTFPYTPGNSSNSPLSQLERSVFLLSMTEFGFSNSRINVEGSELPIADILVDLKLQLSRTPNKTDRDSIYCINNNGVASNVRADNSYPVLTAFTLPESVLIIDGTIYVAPPAPATITVPSAAMQGQPINISWSAVDGADGYILERSADSGAWTQIYQGANLSYTDTAGSWTSVQYRVKAGLDGSYGDYKTSASVPVAAASALVISGTDGSLGTLTADVAYSVSSDTGNQISLSVEVNGAEWLNSQVSSGYDGVLPVMELPVGSGSIVIKATVQASAGAVSATRSWTYSKTALSFPAAAQAGVLQQDGQNFLPATLAELVRTNPFWGGNLDKALELLKNSVQFYPVQTPKYQEVTVDLSTAQEGDIVQLPEGGKLVDFYVAKLNYESTLNGTGRTLVFRKDCYDERQWHISNVNAYASSAIDSWLNSTYKNMLDADIRELIGSTKIRYTPGNGNTTMGTLDRAVFLLSAYELGKSESWFNKEGTTLPNATNYQIAKLNGSTVVQWTRSPRVHSTNDAVYLDSGGHVSYDNCDYSYGSRPAFTLPSTFSATYYVDSSGNLHDEQEYEEGGSTTDVKGNPITIGTQIATGSYVGTGTYGASNPNTITFPFIPKIWGVFCRERLVGNSYNYYFFNDAGNIWIWGKNSTQFGAASSNSDWTITFNGGTVSWYINDTGSTAAGNQFNDSNYTYYVFAIG